MAASPSLACHPGVDAWLAFEADRRVAVRSGKVDVGQRVSAAIALVAAEELDVDPARVRVVARETGKVPDEGYTSGSRSMEEFGAGGAARGRDGAPAPARDGRPSTWPQMRTCSR